MTIREKLKAVVADVDKFADEIGYEVVYQEFFLQIAENFAKRGTDGTAEAMRLIDEDTETDIAAITEERDKYEGDLVELGDWRDSIVELADDKRKFLDLDKWRDSMLDLIAEQRPLQKDRKAS